MQGKRHGAESARKGWLVILLLLTACSGDRSVVPVQNVERAVTVWGEPHQPRARAQMCLEYATPAQELQTTKASIGVPVGKQSINLTYENGESLAQIYTVTEIMQFGHAALYRLCEAAANGQISQTQYHELFAQTLKDMHDLLDVQTRGAAARAEERRAALLLELDAVEDKICTKQRALSPSPKEWNLERDRLIQELKSLLGASWTRADLPSADEFDLGSRKLGKITAGAEAQDKTVSCSEYKALHQKYEFSRCNPANDPEKLGSLSKTGGTCP